METSIQCKTTLAPSWTSSLIRFCWKRQCPCFESVDSKTNMFLHHTHTHCNKQVPMATHIRYMCLGSVVGRVLELPSTDHARVWLPVTALPGSKQCHSLYIHIFTIQPMWTLKCEHFSKTAQLTWRVTQDSLEGVSTFSRCKLVQIPWPTLDLLNPKSIGCDTVLRTTANFQVIPITGTHPDTRPHTHIHNTVTKSSQYRRHCTT